MFDAELRDISRMSAAERINSDELAPAEEQGDEFVPDDPEPVSSLIPPLQTHHYLLHHHHRRPPLFLLQFHLHLSRISILLTPTMHSMFHSPRSAMGRIDRPKI